MDGTRSRRLAHRRTGPADPVPRPDHRHRHRVRRRARSDRADDAPARQELGVEAMSLYRYVNGREDLLEGIVDHMVPQLHLGTGPHELGPADGWQTYLQWLAHGARALARDHPRVFPLIATRHPAAPWIRPPLRSLRLVEDFLATLDLHAASATHGRWRPTGHSPASCSATCCWRPACWVPDRPGRGAARRGQLRRPQRGPEARPAKVPAHPAAGGPAVRRPRRTRVRTRTGGPPRPARPRNHGVSRPTNLYVYTASTSTPQAAAQPRLKRQRIPGLSCGNGAEPNHESCH